MWHPPGQPAASPHLGKCFSRCKVASVQCAQLQRGKLMVCCAGNRATTRAEQRAKRRGGGSSCKGTGCSAAANVGEQAWAPRVAVSPPDWARHHWSYQGLWAQLVPMMQRSKPVPRAFPCPLMDQSLWVPRERSAKVVRAALGTSNSPRSHYIPWVVMERLNSWQEKKGTTRNKN